MKNTQLITKIRNLRTKRFVHWALEDLQIVIPLLAVEYLASFYIIGKSSKVIILRWFTSKSLYLIPLHLNHKGHLGYHSQMKGEFDLSKMVIVFHSFQGKRD